MEFYGILFGNKNHSPTHPWCFGESTKICRECAIQWVLGHWSTLTFPCLDSCWLCWCLLSLPMPKKHACHQILCLQEKREPLSLTTKENWWHQGSAQYELLKSHGNFTQRPSIFICLFFNNKSWAQKGDHL